MERNNFFTKIKDQMKSVGSLKVMAVFMNCTCSVSVWPFNQNYPFDFDCKPIYLLIFIPNN